MDRRLKDRFCRQLALWTRELLDRGRLPFQCADETPLLQTAGGPQAPDLVLWINRDSLMAGGIILIGSGADQAALETGRQCATALGLRHFVLWGAEAVLFQEVTDDTVRLCRRVSAPPPKSDGRAFCQTLAEVLEILKFFGVSGAMTPAQMPVDYLLNLCLGSLRDVWAPLEESLRVARAEPGWLSRRGDVEVQARDKALLTLVRMLALLHSDQMAVTVQPEGLERALFFALDGLPAKLRSPLAPTTEEPPLPLSAAIRFHLLLRRLSQLELRTNPERTGQLLQRLLEMDPLGTGLVLEGGDIPLAAGGPELSFNVLRLTAGRDSFECGSPSVLAAAALLRNVRKLPAPAGLREDLFRGDRLPAPHRVRAILWNRQPLARTERLACQVALRVSWPNQRLVLPATFPRWAFETLHLTGLAASGATLDMVTPTGWLQENWAPHLLRDILLQCTISEIRLEAPSKPVFILEKGQTEQLPFAVVGSGSPRQLGPDDFDSGWPVRLLAALLLPEELWGLYTAGHLQTWASKQWPAHLERGIYLFTRSTLGQRLWLALTGSRTLPGQNRLQQAVQKRGLPLPGKAALLHLQQAVPGQGATAQKQQVLIDQELGAWFPRQVFSANPALPPSAGVTDRASAAEIRNLRDRLQKSVFADGVPCFPEHYLFAHFRPALAHYRFTPPLVRSEEFFGAVIFRDGQGTAVEASSPELARALELVAASGRDEVELPTAQDVVDDILERYLQDLRRLHDKLHHQTHAKLRNRDQARALAANLWREMQLPPAQLFSE